MFIIEESFQNGEKVLLVKRNDEYYVVKKFVNRNESAFTFVKEFQQDRLAAFQEYQRQTKVT